MEGLKLERPLICLDLETTGPNPETDRIVEIGLVRLNPDGTRASARLRIHPGRPIPPEATAVHGITDADVAECRSFAESALWLTEALRGCDLAGFNLRRFDLPVLRREFALAGVPWPCEGARVVDAFCIFRDREPRTLVAAVKFYCGREHTGAHSALSDAEATLDVLLGQLARYPDLPRDLDALDTASGGRQPEWATECGRLRRNAAGELVIHFGRHTGSRLMDMDGGFLNWVLDRDFPADVKALFEAELERRHERDDEDPLDDDGTPRGDDIPW